MRKSPPPFSKKHRLNLSKAKIGNKICVGRIPWNKGKIGVQSNPMKGKKRPKFSGEKHPMWKGGIARSAGLKARREREKNMIGSHTRLQWEMLKVRYGNKCAICGSKEKITKDHIRPIVKGGTNFIENIQPLCKRCNSRKSSKLLLVTRPPKGLYK